MSDTINIQEVLFRHWKEWHHAHFPESGELTIEDYEEVVQNSAIVPAIKEIVEAVIDKCAMNAEAELYTKPHDPDDYARVDKESILNVKKLVVYGQS